MSSPLSSLVSDVVASPLGDVIASVGEGVAAAQRALDEASLSQTLSIYSEQGDAGLAMLRDIGYQPTFYSLPETTGEVTVSLSLGQAAGANGAAASGTAPAPLGVAALSARARAYVTPVDAGFANRYGYSAQVSAKLHFKIVPVPPPTGSDELRLLPSLLGLTVADAQGRLSTLGLGADLGSPAPKDSAVVTAMTPAAGGVVRVGQAVRLST